MYYEVQSNCLYCEHSFTTKKVRTSKAKITHRDSDFCIHYENVNPLFYDILVCPSCGFAYYKSYRALNTYSRKKLKEAYIEKINVPNLVGERTIEDAIYTFKLAILTATIINERKFITANLFLKLGWLYRMTNDKEQEKRFLQQALDDYVDMLANENIEQEDVDEDRLMYLMADLYLRLDHFIMARKLFSQLMTDKKVSPRYKNLAIERWHDYKDQLEAETE